MALVSRCNRHRPILAAPHNQQLDDAAGAAPTPDSRRREPHRRCPTTPTTATQTRPRIGLVQHQRPIRRTPDAGRHSIDSRTRPAHPTSGAQPLGTPETVSGTQPLEPVRSQHRRRRPGDQAPSELRRCLAAPLPRIAAASAVSPYAVRSARHTSGSTQLRWR